MELKTTRSMKTFSVLLLGWLFAWGNLSAEVVVIFQNPDEYRDIDYYYAGGKKGQRIYLPQLKEHIEKYGARHLREGLVLTLTFTDIDLAGEHEPWRGSLTHDIRIVRSIYPPRMTFIYELADADGNVLKTGEERLVDLAFDYRMRTNFHDNLYYDKAMIGRWLRKFAREEGEN